MPTITKFQKSGKKPSLADLVRDSLADQQIIRRSSKDALAAWFRLSERLNIARTDYRLRGDRFKDFARRCGIHHNSAYLLVHLHKYRTRIEARCLDEAEKAARRGETFRYPGWEHALSWFHRGKRVPAKRYWLTPRKLYQKLDAEFNFTDDPCPHPLPEGWNALNREWGESSFLNPPFNAADAKHKAKLPDFIRKAIAENRKGKTVVLVLPTWEYINKLMESGAEYRPAGRVQFEDVDTREPSPHPPNSAVFILRGKKT